MADDVVAGLGLGGKIGHGCGGACTAGRSLVCNPPVHSTRFVARFMPADYHTHTPLCRHAEGDPEAFVDAALAAGLTEYGISDHAPQVPEPFDDWRMAGSRTAGLFRLDRARPQPCRRPHPDPRRAGVRLAGRLRTVDRRAGRAPAVGLSDRLGPLSGRLGFRQPEMARPLGGRAMSRRSGRITGKPTRGWPTAGCSTSSATRIW